MAKAKKNEAVEAVAAVETTEAAEVKTPAKRGRKPKAESASAEAVSVAVSVDEAVKAEENAAVKKTVTKKAATPKKEKAKADVHPYDEVIAAAKKNTSKAKAAVDFAAQITFNGSDTGVCYVKAVDGAVDVQPYDYKNADLYVDVDFDTFADLLAKKTTAADAVKKGKLEMSGAPVSVMAAFCSVLF
ncbi:MAG: SCP2 sterol-binding domain-containing protein [Oscillospiraceae bacterium]|nr:SCP2 sterol-binding domain-containing protein [Oscillospiraceae bacterium]